ncbi:MAG: hypothetical protein JSV58_04705 [Candidatus Bathyarchaeota archaeon]|nr:MAG: hypothetical protein JSV58_04705 [Candidatus Bathyarchaeota archaeon]
MYRYFVWLKTNPTRTKYVTEQLKAFPEQPYNGIRLYYTMNCYGDYNLALWFEAENQDYANDFVEKKVRPIQGVLEAYTVPTTPIKEYIKWK